MGVLAYNFAKIYLSLLGIIEQYVDILINSSDMAMTTNTLVL